MADDAVVLKASLDKRGKTVGSWTKRNVVLRKTELEYTHRFPWTNAVVALSDIINVTERPDEDGLCFVLRVNEDQTVIVEHYFRASSIGQFEEWVSTLRRLVAASKSNGTPQARQPHVAPPITPAVIDKLISDLEMPDMVDNYDFQTALKKANLVEFAHFPLGDRLFRMRCAKIGSEQLPKREAAQQIAEIQQQDSIKIKALTFEAYDADGDGSISRKEFLDIITRTWYQMFRALGAKGAGGSKQQQIVSFAEAKARDLHAMAIDVFTSLEKQCAGGGQLNKETFGNWCEGAKTLRAEADGFGSLSIPITFFVVNQRFAHVAREDHAFQVTVPPGVQPGDELEVTTPSGKKVKIVVPEGAKPGATMTLRLSDDNK